MRGNCHFASEMKMNGLISKAKGDLLLKAFVNARKVRKPEVFKLQNVTASQSKGPPFFPRLGKFSVLTPKSCQKNLESKIALIKRMAILTEARNNNIKFYEGQRCCWCR